MTVSLQYIIIYISITFWLFPAIRQYRTELFWYFLVLAIADPITLLFSYLTIMRSYNSHIIFAYIFLLSLYGFYKKRLSIRIILLVSFVLLITSLFSSATSQVEIITLFHIMIFLFFIMRSIYFISENNRINMFHFFLILYETSVILKLLAVLTDAKTGAAFFNATTVFQILIAIFFTIFRENDSRLFIDLKKV